MQDFFIFFYDNRFSILKQSLQHLYLTLMALWIAIILGLVIGIFLTRQKKLANFTIGTLGVIQTIPSIALLGFLLPLAGTGAIPAIIALFLYALLPIVRNTYTGITEVEKSVKEAAKGMGMSNLQILLQVELPLATPIIFAGIRTAVVINVGIATLCSLIGAGGLGEIIFSGMNLANTYMTLSGAIPAAFLALFLDTFFALLQKYIQKIIRPVLWVNFVLFLGIMISLFINDSSQKFVAGFDSEFRKRSDGYPALQKTYGLNFDNMIDLDAALMYEALKEDEVQVISGYSTEGKIEAYNLRILEDDKNAFPPYYVAPIVNAKTLQRYPQLREIFDKIAFKISDKAMQKMNYKIDKLKISPREIAKEFLESINLKTRIKRSGKADIVIGGKRFAEQYILLEMFKILIENYSSLTVEVKKGMGGTQILFDAVKLGELDIYPEYTGTAFLVILKADDKTRQKIISDKDKVYSYVKKYSKAKHNVIWLDPLGFNNTYCLMISEDLGQDNEIKSISDLKQYLEE